MHRLNAILFSLQANEHDTQRVTNFPVSQCLTLPNLRERASLVAENVFDLAEILQDVAVFSLELKRKYYS